ncbi:MAG TPA: hypothetical protein VGM03_14445 [Phycisphaerae bacterium]|jgi:hypothetical protein
MGNLIKLLVVGAIVIGAIFAYFKFASPTSSGGHRVGAKRDGIEVQEKYGVAPLDSTLTGH